MHTQEKVNSYSRLQGNYFTSRFYAFEVEYFGLGFTLNIHVKWWFVRFYRSHLNIIKQNKRFCLHGDTKCNNFVSLLWIEFESFCNSTKLTLSVKKQSHEIVQNVGKFSFKNIYSTLHVLEWNGKLKFLSFSRRKRGRNIRWPFLSNYLFFQSPQMSAREMP